MAPRGSSLANAQLQRRRPTSSQDPPGFRTYGQAIWRAAGREEETAEMAEKEAFSEGGEGGLESVADAATAVFL